MGTSLFYTAQKAFEAQGRRVVVGEVVDTAGWRLLPRLIEQRYLRLATEAEINAATTPAEIAGPPIQTQNIASPRRRGE